MKYKLVRKHFDSAENIKIPDNAVAIHYCGLVPTGTKPVNIKWLGIHTTMDERVWEYQFEWLEPIED